MALRGDPIWHEIKLTGSARVTVSVDYRDTLIQAVKKAKAVENVLRPSLGRSKFSKLSIKMEQISVHPNKWQVEFELPFHPDKL